MPLTLDRPAANHPHDEVDDPTAVLLQACDLADDLSQVMNRLIARLPEEQLQAVCGLPDVMAKIVDEMQSRVRRTEAVEEEKPTDGSL